MAATIASFQLCEMRRALRQEMSHLGFYLGSFFRKLSQIFGGALFENDWFPRQLEELCGGARLLWCRFLLLELRDFGLKFRKVLVAFLDLARQGFQFDAVIVQGCLCFLLPILELKEIRLQRLVF